MCLAAFVLRGDIDKINASAAGFVQITKIDSLWIWCGENVRMHTVRGMAMNRIDIDLTPSD